jgi:hypothetical protein
MALAGLHEREDLESFIMRPEAAGEQRRSI